MPKAANYGISFHFENLRVFYSENFKQKTRHWWGFFALPSGVRTKARIDEYTILLDL